MMVCKSAIFNLLDLVRYLFLNYLKVSMRTLVWSWIWGGEVMLNEESFVRNFLVLDLRCWVSEG